MKKLFGLMAGLLAVCALAGCGEEKEPEGESGSETNETLPVDKAESKEKMDQLATEGFYFAFSYQITSEGEEPESGSMHYGAKGDTFWVGYEDQAVAVVKGEAKYDYFSKQEGEWKYRASMTPEQAEQTTTIDQTYTAVLEGYIYSANAYDGMLKKGADTTIAGRSCYTYTYDLNSDLDAATIAAAAAEGIDLSQYSMKYEIAVEKQYGITMKLAVSGSSSEGSGGMTFEVSTFVTGNDVNAYMPQLPPAVPANV